MINRSWLEGRLLCFWQKSIYFVPANEVKHGV
jgi:hypothetical protein